MFVQLLFSILLFNFHSIPIYVSPQVPLQVGSPTLTILKLRSFLSSRWPHSIGDHTLHSWPHSTGKPHSTHYNVGHTVKVISLFFFILDFSWGHLVMLYFILGTSYNNNRRTTRKYSKSCRTPSCLACLLLCITIVSFRQVKILRHEA